MKYIHYGSDQYIAEKVRSISAPRRDKPHGLWGSPVNSKWGWKDWCLGEDFDTYKLEKSFCYTLTDEAKILHIKTLKDAAPYIIKNPIGLSALDQLNLAKIYDEFDGMELHLDGPAYNELRDSVFYTWDVDSICVWNPDVIVATT